ncbi:MAG TPA: acetylglutamate kinase [Candidatus Mailhella merdavium]|nr:acetylglutamate kinase [Candidatus Mailhella merdavium]
MPTEAKESIPQRDKIREQAQIQSRVLIESLPYLRRYQDQIIVIKYGGHAMTDEALKQAFALNVALLKLVGIHPVIVHGGGPQINAMLGKLEIKAEFRQGQRVTDDATMNVVEMVLVGSVNKDIVNWLNRAGARAVGLSGKDGMLLEARKRELVIRREDAPPEIIDLGNVGQVTNVNTALIHSLIRDGFVPVIAPVGVDSEGHTYNINADSVAGAVAGALRAKRLLMLTDVEGLLDKNGALISDLTASRARDLQADGTISGGMIPKMECCLSALADGVDMVTIVDGRVENCILLELLTDKGIGTALTL